MSTITIKRLIFTLYTLIVVCIGLATVIEKYRGTTFVSEHIYGAWWFAALWAVLTMAALVYIMKQRLYKRVALLLLHLSFVVILAGALTTHLFGRRGTVRLRTNIPETAFIGKDGKVEHFPFTLTLKEFRIINYPGTDAPLDYQSVIGFKGKSFKSQGSKFKVQSSKFKGADGDELVVSMNHIGNIDNYRLFQQSYDSDGEGVTLGVSYDPYGIGITYFGYLLLLVGIIATLLSRHTEMRALYRKAITVTLLLFSISATADDQLPVVDKDIAQRLGTINVLYNNRICPLNTVATDFTMKLTGSASWHGYSADQVFFSWMIYYMPWEKELLSPTAEPSLSEEEDEHVQVQKSTDEKKAVVEMFYHGQFTKIFPYRLRSTINSSTRQLFNSSTISWFSPGAQVLPREIPVKEQFFIKQSMDFLTEAIVTGQRDRAIEIIAKIKLFQRDMVGDVLPTAPKTKAEIFFNTLRSQKWPVFLALTFSLLLCVTTFCCRKRKWLTMASLSFVTLLLVYVILQLALRWWLGGHIPVSNGPETMLFMAWVLLLLTLLICRKAPILLPFGPLVASFCLLVSMLGGSNSQLTPLMPVLQSPLLSIHVMTVMCAYALFALQMLLGIYVLILMRRAAKPNCQLSTVNYQLSTITALSQLLLYPAVFLLAVGIFLGAVWANVSWGNYWSWDPKESWALIMLMVYAVPLHKTSVGLFHKPRFYHIYMVVSFLAVIITYFGVNYLLGGMHSYA